MIRGGIAFKSFKVRGGDDYLPAAISPPPARNAPSRGLQPLEHLWEQHNLSLGSVHIDDYRPDAEPSLSLDLSPVRGRTPPGSDVGITERTRKTEVSEAGVRTAEGAAHEQAGPAAGPGLGKKVSFARQLTAGGGWVDATYLPHPEQKMSAWARLRSAFSRLDMDDLPKLVTMRDRRLGLLHTAFMIAIFVYIVVFVIIIEKGYLARETPVAVVRSSFLEPRAFSPAASLPYCSQSAAIDSRGRANHPCLYWDFREAQYPAEGSDRIFLTSRVTETREAALPDACQPEPTSPECAARGVEARETYYVADVEEFTLMVDHGALGFKLQVGASVPGMKGRLVDLDGKEIKAFTDGARPGDIMTVRELLQAAGNVDLDANSASSTAEAGESVRSDGLVLVVYIDYGNRGIAPNQDEISYKYKVRAIQGKKYKAEEVLWAPYPSRRVIRNRHGLLITFVAVGEVGVFSFQTMLINLVTALGLMAVATTVTDMLALHLMPQKKYYKEYKFQARPALALARPALSRPALPTPPALARPAPPRPAPPRPAPPRPPGPDPPGPAPS
eukprot:tig00000900_g5356.t1